MSEASDRFAGRSVHPAQRQGVWREIVRFVERDIVDKDSLLELGCGYGDFINNVRIRNRIARDRNERVREHLDPNVRFVHGDCTDLSFLDRASVSNVVASNLLEHLDRHQLGALLPEIRRVLAPRGRFILLQPNYRLCCARYFDDYTHVSVFSDVSLRGFLTAGGFSIVRCIPGLLPFSMTSRLPKHPLLVRLYLRCPVRPLAAQMYVVAQNP